MRKESGLDMEDSYNEKPAPNVRVRDVIGIAGFVAIAATIVYLLIMAGYHTFFGR
jgi:hypothetical protein